MIDVFAYCSIMLGNKVLTLAFVRRQGEILLGYKKRGFGAGKWNGFGGKVETGETIEAAAKRWIMNMEYYSESVFNCLYSVDFKLAETSDCCFCFVKLQNSRMNSLKMCYI